MSGTVPRAEDRARPALEGGAHDVVVAGCRVRSDIPLLNVPAWSGDPLAPVDIAVVLGDAGIGDHPPRTPVFPDARTCLYWEPDLVRVRVADGRLMTVEPLDDRRMADIATLVLAIMSAIIFHQRQNCPLHAGAFALADGVAVAVVGRSGAGKSTLVAAITARGFELVADDVVLVAQTSVDGGPAIVPTTGRQKLWSDSLAALGATPGRRLPQAARQIAGRDVPKFEQPMPADFDPRPRRLGAVCHLVADDGTGLPSVTSMDAVEAHAGLLRNVFKVEFAKHFNDMGRIMTVCGAIATGVPHITIRRPSSFDGFAPFVDEVLAAVHERLA